MTVHCYHGMVPFSMGLIYGFYYYNKLCIIYYLYNTSFIIYCTIVLCIMTFQCCHGMLPCSMGLTSCVAPYLFSESFKFLKIRQIGPSTGLSFTIWI